MSEKPQHNIRIVDIARMAGVSVATVDRVIHRRGKVSAENLARIESVLREVNYEPNLIARSLASGRQYTFCAVIPRFADGEYWADVDAGIDRAAAEVGRFNIVVHKYYFDQYDAASFEELCATVLREEFSAVLIATLFAEQVVPLTRELDTRSIPYVFVDSDIPGCNRLAYFGTSSVDAGMVAARLLTEPMDLRADIVLGNIVHPGDTGSTQWRNREIGFRRYLEHSGFQGRLFDIRLHLNDTAYNTHLLDQLFELHPTIRGAVTFNSTCYILGRYLEARGRRDVRLVGYDIIRSNEQMLRAGVVTALIAQRPEAQGYYAVTALCECLIGGREAAPVNDMPIDILLKENIQFYKTNML